MYLYLLLQNALSYSPFHLRNTCTSKVFLPCLILHKFHFPVHHNSGQLMYSYSTEVQAILSDATYPLAGYCNRLPYHTKLKHHHKFRQQNIYTRSATSRNKVQSLHSPEPPLSSEYTRNISHYLLRHGHLLSVSFPNRCTTYLSPVN